MIYGKNIVIYEGSPAVPIAAAKSCSIVYGSDTLETSSPTSARARSYEAGRTTWTITVSALVLSVRDSLMRVGNTYALTIRVGDSETDVMTGNAICIECSIAASVGNLAQGSFRFLGTGGLT